jgi:hypothetical protein
MRLPALCAAFVLSAAPLAVVCAAEESVSDSALKIQGIFHSQLPGTERKNSLRFILHPHLGDLTNREHLRTPVGVRYGITENWESTLELETYFSHGLKHAAFFEQAGLADLHLGTKYRVGTWPFRAWETAVGVDYTHPLGAPPPDVTDGLTHISPYFTLARPIARHPGVRVFWGLGADLVNRTSLPVTPGKNELGDDTANASAGLVWQRRPYTYTLEAIWSTSTGIGGERDGHVISLRPGVVWEVPSRYTFGAKGQWLLGIGLRATQGPDGLDFGAAAKVRVNFDFARLFNLRSAPTK